MAMDRAAPLLCAGITVYTPLKDNNLVDTKGKKIGVIGLGGLGHVAVKFGKAFGHHVTVISTSPSKEQEAKETLGADDFILSTNPKRMQVCACSPYFLFFPFCISVKWCTFIYSFYSIVGKEKDTRLHFGYSVSQTLTWELLRAAKSKWNSSDCWSTT